MPEGLRYDRLTQTHPEYDLGRITQIEDLYEGGWRIMRKATSYVDPIALEHEKYYAERCKTASYQPYFGQILDQFVADLFTQPLTIQPAGDAKDPATPGEYPDEDFYVQLAKDVDGEGMSVEDLAADILTSALKHRCAYVMVDAPDAPDAPAPETLAEEEAQGLRRCYAYEVDPAQVIDWKFDRKSQRFVWVIVATKENEREDPTKTRELITERFTVWTMGDANAQWARFAITYKPTEPPRPDSIIPLEDSGVTGFDRIPLMRFELPKGLWVGNKIGPQAIEHWRRRSSLIGAEGRSCVAIPWVAQGPEMTSMGQPDTSEVQENPNRGRDPVGAFKRQGFLVLGHQDKLDFAEPKGHAFEIIDKQIEALRESMYSVNHQMAAGIRPTSTALGRSGLSKQKDEDKTAKVLGALGDKVRTFFVRLYDTIAAGRGDDVVWVAHGLDSYEHDDREQVLEESLELQAVNIPSPTFRKEHAKRMVKKLVPNLPPATVAQIFSEIDDGIDAEQTIRDLEQDVHQDMLENPPEPGAPVGGPPKPAKPQVPKAPKAPPKKAA